MEIYDKYYLRGVTLLAALTKDGFSHSGVSFSISDLKTVYTTTSEKEAKSKSREGFLVDANMSFSNKKNDWIQVCRYLEKGEYVGDWFIPDPDV